ncbi:MAG: hypothetical protein ACI4BC_01435 [Muribaculaceae bacterium]
MSWLNIKRLVWAFLLLFLFPVATCAADVDSVWCWNKRTDWHYNGWERLKPRNFMAQYAGGMGFLSFGAGWEYGRSGQWNTDLLVGFIPKAYADKLRFTFTAKQTYTPWHWHFKPQFSLEPLTCGIYVNTIGGEEFWEREPAKYPSGYYTFSTKLRFYLFVGQSITFYPRSDMFRAVKLFYELGTNELYIVSKATNSTLRFGDILRLSFGMKFQIYHPHVSRRQ